MSAVAGPAADGGAGVYPIATVLQFHDPDAHANSYPAMGALRGILARHPDIFGVACSAMPMRSLVPAGDVCLWRRGPGDTVERLRPADAPGELLDLLLGGLFPGLAVEGVDLQEPTAVQRRAITILLTALATVVSYHIEFDSFDEPHGHLESVVFPVESPPVPEGWNPPFRMLSRWTLHCFMPVPGTAHGRLAALSALRREAARIGAWAAQSDGFAERYPGLVFEPHIEMAAET